MAFDLKQKLQATVKGWKPRMQRAGVNSAYAMIAAAALWPVAEAARQGEWAALAALGSLTVGVGANLLANQLQTWKDEADAARQLAALPKDDPIRAELDVVMAKLDALTLAREALPQADHRWFVETLQKELATLGSRVELDATVIGNANVVVQGNGNTVSVTHQTLLPEDTTRRQEEARQSARHRYLTGLRRACSVLPLAALGSDESADDEITLDRVYINLDTTTTVLPLTEDKQLLKETQWLWRDDETHCLSTLEAAGKIPRLVLLGDPGSGKSTFVRRLLGVLASANLGEGEPPAGLSASLMPVLLTLRDLTPYLAGLKLEDLSADRQREALAGALCDQMVSDLVHLEAADFADDLRVALRSGACLLVMDGLDEVPHDLRGRVRQAVGAMLARYSMQRVIVTCRVRSYTGEAVFVGFQAHTLAPFDADKVHRFTAAWYNAQKSLGRFTPEQTQARAADLAQAALSADLRELSSNPMMLTTMAIIHQREIGLPRERVRLYSLAVDVLLRRWQKYKTCEHGLVANFLKDDLRLLSVMERLAYEAHRAAREAGQGKIQTADLPRGTALALLEAREYLGSAGLAAEFLDYVDQRAGLLVGRGGMPDESGAVGHPVSYSFPHRTFQEYLAGCYLAGQRDALRAYYACAGEDDYWNLATQMGAEDLYYNRRNINNLLDLAYHLCPAGEAASEQAQRAVLWSANMALLAGREAVERDTGSPNGGAAYLARLIPCLVGLLGSDLTVPERVDAGRVLGYMGDPRPAVMTVEGMEFCYIPPGPFVMGEGQEQHENTALGYGYWLGRYPVTNAQYQAFGDAGGYTARQYWPEAAAGGHWHSGSFEARNDEQRYGPRDYGKPFNLPNHPVVGVTWYEALAFCRWLNEHFKVHLPEGYAFGLPSEAEWEKAARGGRQVPSRPKIGPLCAGLFLQGGGHDELSNSIPERLYPWGNESDANVNSASEADIGTTSAIGCFQAGASPYGCVEMSGNVFQWTRSLHRDYPYNPTDGRENLKARDRLARELRGGAFNFPCNCAHRYWDDVPWREQVNFGFRLVASPFRL